jgi:hypothetical protein
LAIAVSLLLTGTKLTVSPCALNRPRSSATKKPAESTAGTTATFSTGFSGRGAFAAPPPFEQPAVSARAMAVTSSARPRTCLIPFTLKSFPRIPWAA